MAKLLARADGRRAGTEGAADSRTVGTNHASAGVAVVHELLSIPVCHAIEHAIGHGIVTFHQSASGQANRSTLARVASVGVGLAGLEIDTIVFAALNHRVDYGLYDDRCAFVTISDGGIVEWNLSSIIGLIEESKEASGDGGSISVVGSKGCICYEGENQMRVRYRSKQSSDAKPNASTSNTYCRPHLPSTQTPPLPAARPSELDRRLM